MSPLPTLLAFLLLALPALLVPSGLGLDFPWHVEGRALSLATYAAANGIVAYGLAMLMRFVGLASVVHGALWGIGAYTAAILAESHGWSFWAVLPAAAALPAIVALAIGLPSLRTQGITFIIITLAMCEFMVMVATNWESLTAGPLGIMVFKVPEPLGPIKFETPVARYYLALGFLYAAVAVVWAIARSAFGRRLIAIRDNELLARSLGLHATRHKLAIFAISAAVVGVGGVVYVYHQQAIQPTLFGAMPFTDVLLMVVMGGAQVLGGPALGAWVVQFLPEWLHSLGMTDPNMHRLAYGMLLIAFLLLLPQGLGGAIAQQWRRRWSRRSAPSSRRAEGGQNSETEKDLLPRLELGEVLLEVDGLRKHFRGVHALDGVSFSLRRGEVLGVIGPNGSGKTTLFNCLSGHLRPDGGFVRLAGKDITGMPMDAIARSGLVRTFQHPMSFGSLTVRESARLALDIAATHPRREGPSPAVWSDPDELLAFCGLADIAQQAVSSLSYGHSRMLGVALALAAAPRILMLDEPAAGLNHLESARLARLLNRAQRAGVTLVVVDHDMAFLLPICDRLLVLDSGTPLALGSPQEVRSNPKVVEVYLGKGFADGASRTGAVPMCPAAAANTGAALQVRELVVGYGPILALHGVSIDVRPGEAVALLGANGAGKTTLLRSVSGLLRPRAGQIAWEGLDLTRCSPAQVLAAGIAHVPEGRMIFAQQSVQENLLLGQRMRRDLAQASEDLDWVLQRLPALKQRLGQSAGSLSGGQQQMLAIARGLMSRPKLLILDEPSLGLSPRLVEEVAELIAAIRAERGMSLLLVEQNPLMAARLTERVYVLQNGRLRGELRSQDVLGNVQLLNAYLGEEAGSTMVETERLEQNS